MKRSTLLLIITTMVFVSIGYTQNDNRPRYVQLRSIEILQLASTGGNKNIIAVDNAGKLVYQDVQTLTATDPNPTAGANLVLSPMVGAGGGTVRLVGTGYTTVNYTSANTITISSISMIDKADEFSATVNQTSFTLSAIPAPSSKVKMFINGIRISNSAYTYNSSSTTVTYVPASNGNYSMVSGERVQFDYSSLP